MRTCLLTCFNEGFKPVSDLTLPILMEYCDRHGYSLRVEQNPVCEHFSNGNSIVWHRIKMAQRALRDFGVVVWIDSDCLITNMDKTFPRSNDDDVLVVTQDIHGINDGVMVWEDVDGHGEFMNALERIPFSSSPQDSMNQLWKRGEDIIDEVMVLDQRTMNSYLYEEYNMLHPEGQWQHGDFILHLPGLSIPRRVELLKQYIPQVVR